MLIKQKEASDRAIYERAKQSSDPSMQAYVEWYEGGRNREQKPKPYFRKLSALLKKIMKTRGASVVQEWSEGILAKPTIWAIRAGRRNALKESTARQVFFKLRAAARDAGVDVSEFYKRGVE